MKYFLAMALMLFSIFTLAQRKQDIVPVEVQYRLEDNRINFKFTYHRDMLGFSVNNVRGIDGLSTEGELNSVPKDVKAGQSDTMTYSFTKDAGRAFLILDIRGTVNGMNREQVFAVPIGEPTQEQIQNGMDKDIITIQPKDRPMKVQ